ncbi:MAG: helix-turn-helix domain-containing protein [Lapillicoccus sp.]
MATPPTHPRRRLTAATRGRLERSAGTLSTSALKRMEADHGWYRRLSAEDRSWVGLVVHAAVASFVTWLVTEADRAGGATDSVEPITADVFATAPRELTRSISLHHTLQLVRAVVDVVEHEVTDVATGSDERILREGVLRYSREIAFSAAEVYARAAEARGAWDARLEALVVDAVLRGEADDSMQSRATALGWGSVASVTVVAGAAPARSAATAVDAVRRAASRAGAEALAAVQRRRFVVILGGTTEASAVVGRITDHFGDGPIVVGPTVPHLFAAGRSARAALSGLAAVPAWPAAPRPVHADDLLPERVLAGDGPARRTLVNRIHHPLEAHPTLLRTASVFLEEGCALEATARVLFVHPNTVRYRLGRIADVVGYDLALPREALTVQLALAVGRLAEPVVTPWRAGAPERPPGVARRHSDDPADDERAEAL